MELAANPREGRQAYTGRGGAGRSPAWCSSSRRRFNSTPIPKPIRVLPAVAGAKQGGAAPPPAPPSHHDPPVGGWQGVDCHMCAGWCERRTRAGTRPGGPARRGTGVEQAGLRREFPEVEARSKQNVSFGGLRGDSTPPSSEEEKMNWHKLEDSQTLQTAPLVPAMDLFSDKRFDFM